MRFPGMSRRKFLKKSAVAGGAATLGGLVPASVANLQSASPQVAAAEPSSDQVKMSSPANGEVLQSCSTARLEWEYAIKEKALVRGRLLPYWNYLSVNLKVSPNEDMSHPLVDVHLPDHITSWCLAVLPEHKYYWQIIPWTRRVSSRR